MFAAGGNEELFYLHMCQFISLWVVWPLVPKGVVE